MAKGNTPGRNGSRPTPREAHWRGVLRAWETSGLSQKEFCRRKGHSFTSFHHWRQEIRRRDALRRRQERRGLRHAQNPPPLPDFAPVRVISTPARPPWALEIALADGKAVRVAPEADPETLRKVLAVLEEPDQGVAEAEGSRRC